MSHLPFRFAMRAIDEMDNGQLYLEWETVDNNGYLKIEGDYFSIPYDDEEAIVRQIEELKEERRAQQARPKHKGRRERNAVISDEGRVRIAQRVLEG